MTRRQPADTIEGGAFSRAVTYRVGRPRPGTVRLWTLQRKSVWEALRRDEVLYVDAARIDPEGFQYFRPAYDWMRAEMACRLPGYNGHYPWWAWFRPRPDLRKRPWRNRAGTPCVRLELAVPREQVLLLDYLSWHTVLYGWYLPLTEAEEAAWDAALARRGLEDDASRLPEPWRQRSVSTWQRVFDMEAISAGDYWRADWVQATFEELRLADVVAVTEFTAR